MRHFIYPISILALLSAACSADRWPPPTETAERIDAIREQVWQRDAYLDPDRVDERIYLLEDTLHAVATRHGLYSVEMSQALTESVSLLARRNRFDLALPFMERSLATTRAVYGLHHRETAFALHDLGAVLAELDRDHRVPRAELLFVGARDIRQRLLGEDHGETAASETQLAWQILLGARQQTWEPDRTMRLQEAERLALHARTVFDAQKDASYRLQLRRIALEASLALGRFDEAEVRAREIVADGDYEPGPGLYPQATASDLLVQSLRARQRSTEPGAPDVERGDENPQPERE